MSDKVDIAVKRMKEAAEIRFIRGRLKFGNSKNSAPFPSMLVIYRKDGTP